MNLATALRRSGCTCAEEGQIAVLENNGSISIVPRAAPQTSAAFETSA
jgi:uncharacterized membrane protein YcaP (DUF421 family)